MKPGRNYLPFARQQKVIVPAATGFGPGRISTGMTELATAGCVKAHLNDAMVWLTENNGFLSGGVFGPDIRMRFGVDGRNYETEEPYDWRVFEDGHIPLGVACWRWSGVNRDKPYRVFPGEGLQVQIEYARNAQSAITRYPAVMFNGVIAEGPRAEEPCLLYESDRQVVAAGAGTDRVSLSEGNLNCPKDNAVDLHSVTFPYWEFLTTQKYYIEDINGRPFWPVREWERIVDPTATTILLNDRPGGGDEYSLDPDQTLTFELENWTDTDYEARVTIRGVLEVIDERVG